MEKTICTPNIMTKAGIVVLSAVQIIPLAWGWISYALSSVTASLFTWLSFLSLLWYPVDWGCMQLWMACDVLKQKLKGSRPNGNIPLRAGTVISPHSDHLQSVILWHLINWLTYCYGINMLREVEHQRYQCYITKRNLIYYLYEKLTENILSEIRVSLPAYVMLA